jgi:hypothetical protein
VPEAIGDLRSANGDGQLPRYRQRVGLCRSELV